jgi:DNA primase
VGVRRGDGAGAQELLENEGHANWPKLTGGKGLDVIVPVVLPGDCSGPWAIARDKGRGCQLSNR